MRSRGEQAAVVGLYHSWEYYTFSAYILQVHAQSVIQSNELCLNSNLPLLLQERGADNVEVSKVGPWPEGRTMTGHKTLPRN